MARNYAALKHDYLLEMEELTDAEFGRLCRELLRYSIDGTESQMKGKKSEKTKWFLKKAKETKLKQTKAKKANTKRNTNTKTIVYPLSGEDYTRTRAKAPHASQKQWPITASTSTQHRLGTHCRRWNALRASWGQR